MVQFEPTNGVAYPLRLGESVASDHFASDVISCALRLDFLPASINPHSEGVLEYDKCEHTAELRFPSEVGSHPPVAFKGQFNPQPGGQDYVAIFDGAAFRLERITAAVNLKHAPSSAKRTVARAALDNNQRSTLGDVPDSRGLAADQSRRRAPIEAAPNGVHAATAGAVGTLVGSPSAGSVLNDIEYEFLHGGLS